MKPRSISLFLSAWFVLSLPLGAAPLYWDNSSNDSLWSTIANWSTDAAGGVDPLAVPGASDVATFNATSQTTVQTVNLGGNISVAGLNYLGQSTTLTLQGGGTNVILSIGAQGITASGVGTSTNTGTPPTPVPSKVFNIGNTTAGQNVAISLTADQTWASNISGTVVSTDGIYVKNSVSLGITGNHTLTLGGSSNSTPLNTISGVISDGGSDRSLSIAMDPGALNPNNRWTLSGNNTYTGTTAVNFGALTIGHVNALGATSSGTSVAAGAGLFFRGTVGTVAAEALTIAGNGPDAKGALRNVGGTNTWTGTIAATTPTGGSATIGSDAATLTLSTTADITTSGSGMLRFVGAGTTAVNGAITGAASVTNVAAAGGTAVNGNLVIMANDSKTYTGGTTVVGGTMRVNTAITSTSEFNVGAGGVLQGSGGTINTSIATVINGTGTAALATVSTGNGTGSIGAVTTGELSLGTYSRMIADANFDAVGGGSDRMNVSSLTITSGAALEINRMGTNSVIGATLLLISNSGVWNGGLFTVAGNAVADDTTFSSGTGVYRLDYNYTGPLGTGVAVTLLEVIPEPGTTALVGFAVIAAGLRRRRPAAA